MTSSPLVMKKRVELAAYAQHRLNDSSSPTWWLTGFVYDDEKASSSSTTIRIVGVLDGNEAMANAKILDVCLPAGLRVLGCAVSEAASATDVDTCLQQYFTATATTTTVLLMGNRAAFLVEQHGARTPLELGVEPPPSLVITDRQYNDSALAECVAVRARWSTQVYLSNDDGDDDDVKEKIMNSVVADKLGIVLPGTNTFMTMDTMRAPDAAATAIMKRPAFPSIKQRTPILQRGYGAPATQEQKTTQSSSKGGGGGGGGNKRSKRRDKDKHFVASAAASDTVDNVIVAPESLCFVLDWLDSSSSNNNNNNNSGSGGGVLIGCTSSDTAGGRLVQLQIDTLCIISPTSTVYTLTQALSCAWQRQFDTMMTLLLEAGSNGGGSQKSVTVSAGHYHPSVLPHAITHIALTPHVNDADDTPASIDRRLKMHRLFTLPLDRPIIRPTQQLRWSSTRDDGRVGIMTGVEMGSARLHNVHAYLKEGASGVKDGTLHCVSGDYLYYHYMQDRFNDKGWGCAYRTFQTICSWYILNGYVSPTHTVPTHGEIQRTLVQLGDKPAKFQDSREWIGAIELSLVLNSRLGMTAKTLFVSRGAEIPQHARALAHHFDTNGSPVMIGGGQLSYGLLGVDFNPKSGEIKFLILDPHYTAGEDVTTILRQGWCGWKGADLFIPNTFYNFCLPQRPLQP